MKKKNLLMLPCIATVAIATLVGKKAQDSNTSENNKLLMANVEALADGDNSTPVLCGTKETIETGIICPGHSHLIGFKGTTYSYNAVGYREKYKKGRKGTDESCPDQNQPISIIDEVTEHSCPKKK